jgi:hypothetical protein
MLSAGLQDIFTMLASGSSQEQLSAAGQSVMRSLADSWLDMLGGLLLWKYPTLQPQLHLRRLMAMAKQAGSMEGNEAWLAFLHKVVGGGGSGCGGR